jgi:hypothetical protein
VVAGLVAVLAGGLGIQAAELSGGGTPVVAVAGAELRRSGAELGRTAADRYAPQRHPRKVPSAAGLRRAAAFADGRSGAVSFAVINSEGKLRGRTMNRLYPAASVVKAMLLAAEVHRLEREPIDAGTDSLLRAAITFSDNEAADSIYARTLDAGLNAVAARAGMTEFTVAGHWGNVQIAAADMARFFGDLDRMFPGRHREYAKGLLGEIVSDHRWGIPEAAGEKWAVRFKGGWLPDHALVHQAAELREQDGKRALSIAILTDAQPSHEYGVETVRGVAERLLDR